MVVVFCSNLIDLVGGIFIGVFSWFLGAHPSLSINALYECENKNELIKYLHAALCSPPKQL